jgi:glycerophosphoryl diester phosphodiesterase
MGAFKGAVEVGTHAIETDLHLSKDGIVVLSHVSGIQHNIGRMKLTVTRTQTLSGALEKRTRLLTATGAIWKHCEH